MLLWQFAWEILPVIALRTIGNILNFYLDDRSIVVREV